ncbi:MAG: TIGR03943 family protein [Chloroflexi bacterium]|nr:TIGR03943 family protein [Chloroflexota bacterium]
MYRSLQALILAALGMFFLYKIWSGTLYWYINQRFTALTLIAALGFLALAQAVLARRKQATAETHHEHDGHDHHDHEHPRLPVWSLWVVALPVLLGVLLPAKPLGSAAIANRGVNTTAPLTAGAAQPARLDISPTDRTILDWIRAFNYASDPKTFEDQPADVIGFVYHDSRLQGGQFLAGRFTVNCCVADAMALGVIVQWPDSAGLADNSWVRVRGSVQAAKIDGRSIPLIVAESVESVPPPDQPYLYP